MEEKKKSAPLLKFGEVVQTPWGRATVIGLASMGQVHVTHAFVDLTPEALSELRARLGTVGPCVNRNWPMGVVFLVER